jgi:hypothetical protein
MSVIDKREREDYEAKAASKSLTAMTGWWAFQREHAGELAFWGRDGAGHVMRHMRATQIALAQVEACLRERADFTELETAAEGWTPGPA